MFVSNVKLTSPEKKHQSRGEAYFQIFIKVYKDKHILSCELTFMDELMYTKAQRVLCNFDNFDVNLSQDSKKRSVSFSLTRLCCRPPKECKLQASAVKLWLGKIEREEAREEKEKCCADKVILCAWAITAQSFIQCGQRHSEANTRAWLRRRFTDKGKI